VTPEDEAHRHACEVRWVAKLPSHAARREYLDGVERHRGQAVAQRLRMDVWALLQGKSESVAQNRLNLTTL
jgi:hypothetical protein